MSYVLVDKDLNVDVAIEIPACRSLIVGNRLSRAITYWGQDASQWDAFGFEKVSRYSRGPLFTEPLIFRQLERMMTRLFPATPAAPKAMDRSKLRRPRMLRLFPCVQPDSS